MYHLIDWSRIVIGGHSEGAEAAQLAFIYNNLQRPTEHAEIIFPEYGFNITGLVNIAGTNKVMYA